MCWSTTTCTTQEIILTNEGQSHINRIFLIWIKGQPQSGIIGKALKKTSTAIGFWFLNFGFEYLKDFKVLSRFIQNASNPPTCWDHGLYGHIPRSFPPNCAPKMREIQQFFLGLRPMSKEFQHSAIKIKNRAALWRIFSANKSVTTNRKKGF
jgi:hypothetical protein